MDRRGNAKRFSGARAGWLYPAAVLGLWAAAALYTVVLLSGGGGTTLPTTTQELLVAPPVTIVAARLPPLGLTAERPGVTARGDVSRFQRGSVCAR